MSNPNPWPWNSPMSTPEGLATPEFLRWLSIQLTYNTLLNTATPESRKIIAGTGLTGGGDLSSDRTIALAATLGQLSDVDNTTTPPSNGQVLGFNGTKWIPVTVANPLSVYQAGTSVVGSVVKLNFTGSGVTVTTSAAGEADIAITGGSSLSFMFTGDIPVNIMCLPDGTPIYVG